MATQSSPLPIVVPVSDVPLVPVCCQRAHARGYRRGYRDGYLYACWDLGALVRLKDALWYQIEAFREIVLRPWVTRAYKDDALPVCRELGPCLGPDQRIHTEPRPITYGKDLSDEQRGSATP
jgi:hypothetical protein